MENEYSHPESATRLTRLMRRILVARFRGDYRYADPCALAMLERAGLLDARGRLTKLGAQVAQTVQAD